MREIYFVDSLCRVAELAQGLRIVDRGLSAHSIGQNMVNLQLHPSALCGTATETMKMISSKYQVLFSFRQFSDAPAIGQGGWFGELSVMVSTRNRKFDETIEGTVVC